MSEAKQKDAVNNININVNINERDSSKQEIAKTKQEMCRAKKRQKTIQYTSKESTRENLKIFNFSETKRTVS